MEQLIVLLWGGEAFWKPKICLQSAEAQQVGARGRIHWRGAGGDRGAEGSQKAFEDDGS